MIPIVYKGQNVNPDVMMRRTPLPELYKYLRQHLDYKQMKTKDNLSKFEQMFGGSDEEDDEEEESAELGLDQMLKARAAQQTKSTATGNLSNEAKFENLLRQVHDEEEEVEEEESEEEEYYEEEVITPKESRKMDNLALFEKMTGDYEEEVL